MSFGIPVRNGLGLGLGTYLHDIGVAPKVVTGHDFRSYSLSIKQALTIGLTVDDVNAWPARIRAVSAEGVRKAAQSLSRKTPSTNASFLPGNCSRNVAANRFAPSALCAPSSTIVGVPATT